MNRFAWQRCLLHAIVILGIALSVMPRVTSASVDQTVSRFTAPLAPTGLDRNVVIHRVKDVSPADNTGRNERDRDGQTMTPLDQSNDPKDLKITQRIRKALVADEALSTTAKNIMVITVHGKVILRGPVATVQEKKNRQDGAKVYQSTGFNDLAVAAQ